MRLKAEHDGICQRLRGEPFLRDGRRSGPGLCYCRAPEWLTAEGLVSMDNIIPFEDLLAEEGYDYSWFSKSETSRCYARTSVVYHNRYFGEKPI